MFPLLIPLGVVLIAAFAVAATLTAVEQQNARAAQRQDEGFSWVTAVSGVFGVLGLLTRKAQLTFNAIISRYAGAKLPALAAYFTSLDVLARSVEGTILPFAATVADALDHQGQVVIPRVDRRAKRAGQIAAGAAGTAAATDAALKRFRRSQDRTDARQGERIDAAAQRARGAHRAADRAHTAARTATGRADAAQRDATKALTRTRAAAFAGTLAAVMVGRLGFRWWRCSAFRRVGRSLNCGHWAFLEGILALAFDVLTVAAICRLLPLADSLAARVEGILRPVYFLTDNICEPVGMTLPSAVVRGVPERQAWLPSGL